jgi:DNA-directed RNA polymerase subunit RPC12/RpoP
MSKKVPHEIVAGIEMAVARAKAAKRRGRAKLHALRRADSYSRAEVLALGKAFPTRGALCHHCGLRIPGFAELNNASQRRVRALIREDRPIMAIQELRALTGCSLPWARLWVHHAGRPRALRPGPPCPFCGESLENSRAQRCRHCGHDWQGDSKRDPDRKRIPIDPTARCHP